MVWKPHMVLLEKKIKSLFNVNYNKPAKLCNPRMDVCKKVNKIINGIKLSNININKVNNF